MPRNRLAIIKSSRSNKTLSEGEKTIITFLYFLEQCLSETKDGKNKTELKSHIIVIDDPISSLSYNYLFEISSLIYYKLIKPDKFAQMLILSHNLYFFNELIILLSLSKDNQKHLTYTAIDESKPNKPKVKRSCKIMALSKNVDGSTVRDAALTTLLNPYERNWEFLRETSRSNDKSKYEYIVPNVMRNILEQYYAFTKKYDSLKNLISEPYFMEDPKKLAFYRIINRHSHSDLRNIGDIHDIHFDEMLEVFRKVFELTDDLAHYDKMMQ